MEEEQRREEEQKEKEEITKLRQEQASVFTALCSDVVETAAVCKGLSDNFGFCFFSSLLAGS